MGVFRAMDCNSVKNDTTQADERDFQKAEFFHTSLYVFSSPKLVCFVAAVNWLYGNKGALKHGFDGY